MSKKSKPSKLEIYVPAILWGSLVAYTVILILRWYSEWRVVQATKA